MQNIMSENVKLKKNNNIKLAFDVHMGMAPSMDKIAHTLEFNKVSGLYEYCR